MAHTYEHRSSRGIFLRRTYDANLIFNFMEKDNLSLLNQVTLSFSSVQVSDISFHTTDKNETVK